MNAPGDVDAASSFPVEESARPITFTAAGSRVVAAGEQRLVGRRRPACGFQKRRLFGSFQTTTSRKDGIGGEHGRDVAAVGVACGGCLRRVGAALAVDGEDEPLAPAAATALLSFVASVAGMVVRPGVQSVVSRNEVPPSSEARTTASAPISFGRSSENPTKNGSPGAARPASRPRDRAASTAARPPRRAWQRSVARRSGDRSREPLAGRPRSSTSRRKRERARSSGSRGRRRPLPPAGRRALPDPRA